MGYRGIWESGNPEIGESRNRGIRESGKPIPHFIGESDSLFYRLPMPIFKTGNPPCGAEDQDIQT